MQAKEALDAKHREYAFLNGNETAVVFVHGILGSPLRFRPLAEALSKRGVDSAALLLPGHGGAGRDFYRTPRGAWQAYVKARVRQAAETHRRVFLAGYSLGGLLSLDCALDGLASGVVLINTPVRLRVNLRAVAHSMRMMLVRADDAATAAYRELNSIAGARAFEYPLWAGQYVRMYGYLRRVRRRLGEVRVPALVVQSAMDESIHEGSAEALLAGIPGAKELKLPESRHGNFTANDSRRLLEAMLEFMTEARPACSTKGPAG
jgi:carboxylesterase